jgi:hypothetical protein
MTHATRFLLCLALLPWPAHAAPGGAAPAGALDGRGLANLTAFTRLLGYVRHFHPSDEAAGADWNAFAISAVDAVEAAGSPEELAALLRRIFLPLAPSLSVDTRPTEVAPAVWLPPGSHPVALTEWLHHGYGDTAEAMPDVFWSRRQRFPLDGREPVLQPERTLCADLGGGVWCALPLRLACDSAGTLPRAELPPWEPPAGRAEDAAPSGDERAVRLADAALFWNVAQHFYPYFDVTGTDWPAALREALRRAATDRDGAEFTETLRRLVARLDDGHGGVGDGRIRPGALPLAWAWIENRLVVTGVLDSLAGVRPGDVVRAVDGVPVERRLAEIAPALSHATPQYLRWLSTFALMRGAGGDSVTLELEGPAAPRRVRLGRLVGHYVAENRPAPLGALRPGIWYVDLDRVTDADFATAVDSLAAARGIVFDLRGYPRRISTDPLAHLTDVTLASPPWATPVINRPDHREAAYTFLSSAVAPLAPRFHARVAFVVDGRAISRAETYLEPVAHYRLGEIVGEASAGTDGEVVTVALPGGYRARFTGMKVLKNDGTRLHGVGVTPTVPAARTRAGVAAGRDELLERALELVSR